MKTQNYTDEIRDLINLAGQGDAAAQCRLGVYYYTGEGVDQDYEQAINWFRRAAEQGLAPAQHGLGVCYYNGESVDRDYKQAISWFRKAAEQGNADAQFMLGMRYYTGEGVDQDYEQAINWLGKAAEQGHPEAQCNLGIWYYTGEGVKKDHKQAVKWFRKAAEQGHPDAQFSLGVCYYDGKGVERGYKQAVNWFRKAAEQGLAPAQHGLGICYYNGEGIKQNYKQAVNWLGKAAKQGHDKAKTQLDKVERGQLNMKRTEVFISYTHTDKKYLNELKVYLDSLNDFGIEIWYDGMIKTGAKWKKEIREHIAKARVAILMVSQAFLHSDFVRNEELPELLQAAEKEHATIMWVPVNLSTADSTPIKGKNNNNICIADYQAVTDPKRPLSEMDKRKREKIYIKLFNDIKKCFKDEPSGVTPHKPPS